jgi:endonuclease YncB( thermonuclease family)
MACRVRLWTLGVVLGSLLITMGIAVAELASFAFVQADGSLRLKGRTIHLYGIHIPVTDRDCRTFQQPLTCGSRAALALDFKKGANFVHCEPTQHHSDGSLTALCRVKGEDLSAYLLERGWAVALPDAPFEYQVLEEIAKKRGFGIWGIALDPRPLKRRD